jgi:hypothetical protein
MATFSVLPAIDAVYCPDGCTDANQPRCTWQANVCGASGSCGLCINAVALHCALVSVDAVERLTVIGTTVAFGLVSVPPRAVDRPPRRS